MNQKEDVLNAIDIASLTVSTEQLDISFGEISSMYDGEELEIRPSYQRLFRWTLTQQSQFIESLLLGLPIPPIFVVETETRKYELIDGLQRVSSYLHFVGALNSERYHDGQKLVLRDCEIVKELNGVTIDQLSPALRIKVKRSYIRMYIIKKESPPRLKYDMFKRLNTGGSLLEAQEIRNSTIRLLSEDFTDFIQKLSKNLDFRECISFIHDYQIERQFDDELVLRFFTLKNKELKESSTDNEDDTLASFLTYYAEEVAGNYTRFDYEKEQHIYEKTFALLNKVLGRNVFSDTLIDGVYNEQFHAFYYEAISIATAKIIDTVDLEDQVYIDKFRSTILNLKRNEEFRKATENKKFKRTNGREYVKWLNIRIKLAQYAISNI